MRLWLNWSEIHALHQSFTHRFSHCHTASTHKLVELFVVQNLSFVLVLLLTSNKAFVKKIEVDNVCIEMTNFLSGACSGSPPQWHKSVLDLEGVPRVPWNPPFKDKLVQKSIFYLPQPDSKHKSEKHASL